MIDENIKQCLVSSLMKYSLEKEIEILVTSNEIIIRPSIQMKHISVKLTDLKGLNVYSRLLSLSENDEFSISTSLFKKGVYSLIMLESSNIIESKLILIQ